MAVKIDHNREMTFEYGEVTQLSPLIRRVICKNPGPFTYKGTGTFIIGRGSVAVLDPGPALDSHIDAILAALGPDEEVSHILVSHTHSDHSPGAAPLQARTGAQTYGYGPHGKVQVVDPDDKIDFSSYISADERTQYEKEYADLDPALKYEGPDKDFIPDVKVDDGDVIEGPGWSMEGVWTPGHCSNHLCFALREENSMFSGDHVMAWATSVVGPPDGSMNDYLRSLRKILPRGETTYYPNHGPAVDKPREYVKSFIDHREDREQQILAYIAEGPKRIADFVPTMYESYDKRLWYPAAASVYAHILGMLDDGRIRIDGGGEPKLNAIYRMN